MARFLRDQQITNITIGEDEITQISTLLTNSESRLKQAIPKADDGANFPFCYFTIRFDSKGYRVFNREELLSYFRQAKEVERIIFTLETGESLRSNRDIGVVIELRLDQKNPSNCLLLATSDDQEMVDSSFFAIQEVLNNCKNKHEWVRNAWMELLVQVIGIAFCFILAVWGASQIAPKLSIDYSFIICIFFLFLVFLNIWSFLNKRIYVFLNYFFPNIDFYRLNKHRITWLMRIIITTIVGTITLWTLALLSSSLLNIFSSVVT